MPYINGATDLLRGSITRSNINTTTPNQALITKIIAGNGISISSSGVDPGTGNVVISMSGGSGDLTASRFVTDYDNNITGLRNSNNVYFTLTNNFIANTTHVYVNGVRQSKGSNYDYLEYGTNQIQFMHAPDLGDLITVDYIKQ